MSRTGGVGVSPPDFVGRADGLAAVTRAIGGGPSLVLIEGEPGIGKSRLVQECLASPEVRDRSVLFAACPPLREPFPLGPIVDGLRRFRPHLARMALSPLAGALRPLFPEWADALPPALAAPADPRELRHRLLRALTELVERLGIEVLVIEDAHWADAVTLDWLLTLGTTREPAWSVVITYRPTDVSDSSSLVRLSSRAPGSMRTVRLELAPLDVAQTGRLVGSMFDRSTDGAVSESFAAFLHEHTDGIPLAVEESVRLLRDRGDIVRVRGRWSRRGLGELGVPPTVRDSVLERVARLDPPTRSILEAAAALAAPAGEPLLTVVAGLAEDAARMGVAGALVSGLLQETGPGRFGFRHTLDEQAVGSAIPASEWRRLHGRAVRALRDAEPEAVVRLARHARELGDVEAWCGYAEASAALAIESGDDRTAVVTLLELMRSADHPLPRRVRLAKALGRAAFFGASALRDLATPVVSALREVLAGDGIDPGARGELRLLLGRMLGEVGEVVPALGEFEAAVPDLDHRPDLAIWAMVNLALPMSPDWPADRHLEWLARAHDLAPRLESGTQRLMFTMHRAGVLLMLGEERGWEIAGKVSDDVSGPRNQHAAAGLLNVTRAMLAWGRYGDTRRQLDAAAGYLTKTGYQRFVSAARTVEVYLDWYAGRWGGLREAASELAESDETLVSDQIEARQILGLLDAAAGEPTAAARRLREVIDGRAGVADPIAALAPAALGRLQLAGGAPGQALQATASMMEMIARKGVWLWAADIAPVHVDALVAAGRRDRAARLVDRFADGIDGRAAPAAAAALRTCRAILAAAGDPGRGAGAFALAAAAWAALPRPYDELLALERQGRCLLAAGNREQGLAGLSGVEIRLQELGARWDADRIAQLLRRHGVEVVRAWRRGPRGYGDRLSPRELAVVRLAARGLTNKQIAGSLFVSAKTVASQLSAAMRKLGAPSRTAVAMVAAQAGLLSPDPDEVPTGN
jgi:DNA-binding CsgD family transcriptional regulator